MNKDCRRRGEFESFVLNMPLFKKELKIVKKKIVGVRNSKIMEIGGVE